MKCQQCVAAGLSSIVTDPGYGFSTAMADDRYYDKEGVYHIHDMNTFTKQYSCSQGHRWAVSQNRLCPAPDCGWSKEATLVSTPFSMHPPASQGDGT